jgi:ABC-type glutathione transport system ATPase component
MLNHDLVDHPLRWYNEGIEPAAEDGALSIEAQEPIVTARGLSLVYDPLSQQPIHAYRSIDLDLNRGEYLIDLGHHGCGKSDLGKHADALLRPTGGYARRCGPITRGVGSALDMVRLMSDTQKRSWRRRRGCGCSAGESGRKGTPIEE